MDKGMLGRHKILIMKDKASWMFAIHQSIQQARANRMSC